MSDIKNSIINYTHYPNTWDEMFFENGNIKIQYDKLKKLLETKFLVRLVQLQVN